MSYNRYKLVEGPKGQAEEDKQYKKENEILLIEEL